MITGSMIVFFFLNPKIAMLLKLQNMTAPCNVLLHFQNSLSDGWDDDSLMSLTARWDHNQASFGRKCLSSSPCVYPLPYKRQNRLDGTLPPPPAPMSTLREQETPRTINTFKDITALSRSPIATGDYAGNGSHLTHGETT